MFPQIDKEYLDKGDDYYKNFDLINAAKNYESAHKQNPNNYIILKKVTRIFNDLGEDYYELKDEKNAEIAVNKAVKYAEIFYSKFLLAFFFFFFFFFFFLFFFFFVIFIPAFVSFHLIA